MSDFNFVATDCRIRPWCAHQLRPADADGGGGEGGHQEHRGGIRKNRGAAGAGAGWEHEWEASTHTWNVNANFYGLFDQFSASNVMQFNFMLHLKWGDLCIVEMTDWKQVRMQWQGQLGWALSRRDYRLYPNYYNPPCFCQHSADLDLASCVTNCCLQFRGGMRRSGAGQSVHQVSWQAAWPGWHQLRHRGGPNRNILTSFYTSGVRAHTFHTRVLL